MGSCKKSASRESRAVVLVFKRDQLLYDLGNYAFVEGDVMDVKEEHDRHQVMDIVQDGNDDIVTRVLNLAHTEAVELLYPYTKRPVEDDRLDDTLEEREEYVIEMAVPATFSRTSMEYLRWLIHEYLVYRVLYEWMGLTNLANPRSRLLWKERIEDVKAKIKAATTWRGRPVRIKPYPF